MGRRLWRSYTSFIRQRAELGQAGEHHRRSPLRSLYHQEIRLGRGRKRNNSYLPITPKKILRKRPFCINSSVKLCYLTSSFVFVSSVFIKNRYTTHRFPGRGCAGSDATRRLVFSYHSTGLEAGQN